MKKSILFLVSALCSMSLFAQSDSSVVVPTLSLKEQFGIDKHSVPALIIANLLIVVGFYLPILYNYAIRGIVQKTFLEKKQLLAMNLVMLIIACLLVLVPQISSLIAQFGIVFDAENSKVTFVLLGFGLYGAKLQGKLLKENKDIKTINSNLQDKANEENVG